MDHKEIVKSLQDTLEKTLPEAVNVVVDEKMKSLQDDLTAKHSDIQKQLEDISKAQKFGENESKKSLHQKTSMFFKALVKKDFGAMQKAAFLNETTDAEGGYMVPTEFSREVIRVANNVGFIRKYARIIPMSTDTKDITKLISGVTVYWTAEGAAYTGSKPGFGQVKLICNKLTALVSGTNELIDDNQTDEEVFNLVRDLIAEAMAEFEDNQSINGSGSGANFPGIAHASSGIQSQAFGTGRTLMEHVTYKDLVAIKNKIAKKYLVQNRNKIAWVMSQSMYSAIEALTDTQGRPLIKESIKGESELQSLFSYPVEIVESFPSTNSANQTVLAFGNFAYYFLGDRKQITFEMGYATGGFETDTQSLKANERIGAKIAFTEAFVLGKTAAS